ncbi:ParB/RepB/Spo0J family partition protein [Sphingomonas sp. S2-65]|uniref:ParB/RepB/Spo0J family partition protein n=1 Tax=Sphingomonas sp. S2-65 TaxID=2903960 RepID=UPI0029E7DF2D|nr:ParB/RepB/Spo0J family partition protein [Sphingomonas sp. S2-65]
MKLDFIPLDRLYVDKANMRFAKRLPDVADILPSVRKRGILQTLIVRPGKDERFGILAGARRFRAAGIVAAELASADEDAPEPYLLPCAILDPGDDAGAVEASLIENLARLDPDEVTRWETFVRLVKEGRSPDEIADTFALPVLAVRRTLALGNLLPRIRDLYRRDKIDGATVRHLTLASKARQKDWLALWDAPDTHCPTGWQLRGWLFGGQAICASYALFDVEASGVALVADLFNEQRYLADADADAFWKAQNEAIERGASPIWRRAGRASRSCRRASTSRAGNMRRPPSARAGASLSTCAPAARSCSTRAISAARKRAASRAARCRRRAPGRCVRRSQGRCRPISTCIVMPPCAPRCSTARMSRCG